MTETPYRVVIERAGANYSAYVPDLPGCIAAADTIEETARLIHEGIAIYLDELRVAGEVIPVPTAPVNDGDA